MATFFTFHTGRPIVQIIAVEITTDHLLDIGPPTPRSRTCSLARTLAEHHDLYLDKLQACQNHALPVDHVRMRPE